MKTPVRGTISPKGGEGWNDPGNCYVALFINAGRAAAF